MSNDATFKPHINQVILSSRHQSSWILLVFQNRSPLLMVRLWKSMVLPTMEYCSQLWSPYKQSEISSLEATQWSYLRKIDGTHGKNYWETLKWLNMYSLQQRRERYQLIYTWKIIESFVPDFGGTYKAINYYISPRRGRLCKLPSVIPQIPYLIRTKM